MVISKAAVGFLVGAGIAAGAGGAYIASKSEPAAVTAGQSNALVSTAAPAGPVEQSEAVVNDVPEAPQAESASPVPTPARMSAPRATVRDRRRNEPARLNCFLPK